MVWFGPLQFVSRNLELSSRNRQLEAELRTLHQSDEAVAEAHSDPEGREAAHRRREKRRLPQTRGDKLSSSPETATTDKVGLKAFGLILCC